MKRVYVAGKLNAKAVDYLKNVSNMIKAGICIQRLGYSVFIPCNDLLAGIVAGDYEYPDYAGNNMAWLEVSDIVYVIPHSEKSKGTRAEIKRAKKLKIPVVYNCEELGRVK